MEPHGDEVVEQDPMALARPDVVAHPTAVSEVYSTATPPNLQRAGVESAGSGDGPERQLAEALVAEGQLWSDGLEGRHYLEEADGEQRGLRGRSLRPTSLPDDAEEGQARGAEGHRGRDPQVDEGRPSRSRAPTPHSHRTARRFAEASQRVGGAMHIALRRRGRQGQSWPR